MKSLVVFYSLDGNTRLIAEMISKELESDLIELKTNSKIPTTKFKKYFFAGMHAAFNQKPALQNEKINFDGYDLIFIGTPVWASNCAPAINTLIEKYPLEGKKLALYACCAGGDAQKCLEKLKKAYEGNKIIGEKTFTEPKNEDSVILEQSVKEWVSSLSVL